MQNVISIINQLRATTKTNEKLKILTDNKDNELLKSILYYTYNLNLQYGFSESKLRELLHERNNSYSRGWVTKWDDLFSMLKELSSSNINDSLRSNVTDFIAMNNIEQQELIINVLTKDLRANISEKTINKVWKDLIPTWEIQQGRPIEKAPLKKGERFILSTKANGINCSYYRGKLISRQGKEIKGLDYIIEQIESLGQSDNFINGELIRKNVDNVSNEENFRMTTSIVNSDAEVKLGIDFVIFDMLPADTFDEDNCLIAYIERVYFMKRLGEKIKTKNIENVDIINFYYEGIDQSMVDYYLDIAVKNDEEGLMCIPCKSLYKRKRHNDIKKVKRFYNVDLKVVGREVGTGKYKDTLGSLIVEFKGNTVGVGSGFTDEDRSIIWAMGDDILGKIIEVKYKEITKDKKTGLESLQFPIFCGIKFDKSEESYN